MQIKQYRQLSQLHIKDSLYSKCDNSDGKRLSTKIYHETHRNLMEHKIKFIEQIRFQIFWQKFSFYTIFFNVSEI